jgi:hypothetical protein
VSENKSSISNPAPLNQGPSSSISGDGAPGSPNNFGWEVINEPGGARIAGSPTAMALYRRVRDMSRNGGLNPTDANATGSYPDSMNPGL